jgi:endonuclease/exonuclease/phosphatase family metal-dependent hydrolase
MNNTYLQKYLKYKQKYICGKSKIISGGVSNTINITIYSFNVLNGDPNTSIMTFKNYNSKTAKQIAIIDSIRFHDKRKYYIKELIDIWFNKSFNQKCIICLQEVNQELLDLLKEFYPKIAFTRESDSILLSGNMKNKIEYRVTICSQDLDFIDYYDIQLSNGISRKNALYSLIKLPNGKIIQNINLHIHYLTDLTKLSEFGQILNDKILKEYSFFICGDFNKPLSDLKHFIQKIPIKDIYSPTSFTSFDTRVNITSDMEPTIKLYPDKNIYLETIDYIFIGGVDINYISKPNIITNVDDIEIFYDLESIHKLLIPLLSNNPIECSRIWSEVRNKKDISDHKPIITVIEI